MPSKSTVLVILGLVVVAVLSGYNYFFRPFEVIPPALSEPEASLPPTLTETELRLQSLTPQQKITQLLAYPVIVSGGTLDASDSAWVNDHQPGFVTLFGNQMSTQSAQQAVAQLKASAGEIPLAVAVDHEGGTTQRLNGSGLTRLPGWQSLCAQPASVSAALLAQSAQEVSQAGVDIVLAPVVDLAVGNPALGSRTCSDDPVIVTEQASRFISSFQAVEVLPVLKHFPGIGSANRDLHTSFDQVTITPVDAQVYSNLLDRYPELGVMVTHVGLTNQYPDIPCSLSRECVNELSQNYPETLIFSDALEMVSAGYQPDTSELRTLSDRAYRAILAGNQVLIFGPSVTPDQMVEVVGSLVSQYQVDQEFAAVVDQRLLKVLAWKERQL